MYCGRKGNYSMKDELHIEDSDLFFKGFSPNSQKNRDKPFFGKGIEQLSQVGQVGLEMALPIVGGALLGSYIDSVKHTEKTYTIALLALGSILTLVNGIRFVMDYIQKSKKS